MRYFGFECNCSVLVTVNINIVRTSNETVKIKINEPRYENTDFLHSTMLLRSLSAPLFSLH